MERVEVGLTQFIDFSLKQGSARVTFVRQIKSQPDYQVAFDYWRRLREEIKNVHENNLDLSHLDELLNEVPVKKKAHYDEAISQYKKFCKGKEIQWFDAGKSYWSFQNLSVRSTPELGLMINGVPHLVKLYFKERSEKLDKRGSLISLALMKESINNTHGDGVVHSILNIKKGRLIPLEREIDQNMRLALEADADQLLYLWNNV